MQAWVCNLPAGRERVVTPRCGQSFDSQPPCETLCKMGICPFVKHRVLALYDHAHNARIEDDLYNQAQ